MGKVVHKFRAFEMRKISHPVFSEINKYWMTLSADELPQGISTAANARDPVGLNRRVYRDVRNSLDGLASEVGMFDLMNKGITILADSVKVLNKQEGLFEVTIDDEIGGIVDGAHTAKIIWEGQSAKSIPDGQYVEVYIRTGISGERISEIARGLNTGIQVAPQSIYNKAGVFDWLKQAIETKPFAKHFSWSESDEAEYDVRDIIGVLEALNVFDFPNDINTSKHPIAAYEKWSAPLKKFADDYEENKNDLKQSKYFRLRHLLNDGLFLYDTIRHDFRQMHNATGGSAAKLKILEEASDRAGSFSFPFAGLPSERYRLSKGPTFPMLAAFRSYVQVNPKTGDAEWRGGFGKVLQVWQTVGPNLVEETYQLTRDGTRNPDVVGKNRKHWAALYMRLQVQVLQDKLLEQSVSKKKKH